jgi:hypothetical protein
MDDGFGVNLHCNRKIQNLVQINHKNKIMLTIILYFTGIIGFALFYKFINWFEKI